STPIQKDIAEQLERWNILNLSRKQKKMLIQKLSDISQVSAPIAASFVDIIKFHDWRLTSARLPLLPEETRSRIDPNVQVTLANRYLKSILIKKEYFEQLNDTHKIGLIIHELAYSMARLKGESKSPAAVRQITAFFFFPTEIANLSHRILEHYF